MEPIQKRNKKVKNRKYHAARTVQKVDHQILEDKIDTPNMHTLLFSQLVTETSIKRGSIKLVLCAKTSRHSTMMTSYTFVNIWYNTTVI